MNEPVYFVRHGKPNLPFDSYEEIPFSLLCDLAQGKINPGIDELKTASLLSSIQNTGAFLQKNISLVTSPILRAQETMQLFRKQFSLSSTPLIFSELQEIQFSLSQIYVPDEKGINMSELNHAVLQAVIDGEHAEPLASIFLRITSLFEKLNRIEGPILCVTHDFFMRGIELYIRHKGNVDSVSPQELFTTKTNHPCCGFETTKDFSYFKDIS